MKKFNYKHIISWLILAGGAAWIYFRQRLTVPRLFISVKDLGISVAYWFLQLFKIDVGLNPSVNEHPAVEFWQLIGVTYDEFIIGLKQYWDVFFSTYILKYLSDISGSLYNILYFGSNIALFVLMFIIVIRLKTPKANNDYNKKSKPLLRYLKIKEKLIHPVINWFKEFYKFFVSKKAYSILSVLMLLLGLNLLSVGISFFAYYFYFVTDFKIATIPMQLYKLLLDIILMLQGLPVIAWIIIGIIIFDKIRKSIAYSLMPAKEAANQQLLSLFGIVLFIVGKMRTGKTKLITDMQLSQAERFRSKSLEKMHDISLRFPDFPFVVLERAILKAKTENKIRNLATVTEMINNDIKAFEDGANEFYSYDFTKLEFDNGVVVQTVFDNIRTYAKLFYVYTESVLFLSNYAVRENSELIDGGNLPVWQNDIWKRPSVREDKSLKYSHIIDYDMLRPGKKLKKNNKANGSLEFGIIGIAEVGKERGNTPELKGVEKRDEQTNQKNDLFNLGLKMMGHAAMIDYDCYVKMFMDEQRPESLGADARELTEIIHIADPGKDRMNLPFWDLEDLISNWLIKKYREKNTDYRYIHGDITLGMYLFRRITSYAYAYRQRMINTFGFRVTTLKVEDGVQDGIYTDYKWYSQNKKIYALTYATDSYSSFYRDRAAASSVGLKDVDCYSSIHPTLEELEKNQNSYFISDIVKYSKPVKDNCDDSKTSNRGISYRRNSSGK